MTPDETPAEREQQVAHLLAQAALSERAPQRLREQVTALRTRERTADGRRSGLGAARAAMAVRPETPHTAAPAPTRPTRRWGSLVGIPLAVVGLILVVSLARGSHAAGPSVVQAAAIATLSPAQAAPPPDPAAPHSSLTAAVQGLHFPNWTGYGGWRATGARRDEIRGRAITTVFYSRAGTRLAYSIVASPALANTGRGPDAYDAFHRGGRTYIVWTVLGHTCLLSGVHVTPAQLWRLGRTTTQA